MILAKGARFLCVPAAVMILFGSRPICGVDVTTRDRTEVLRVGYSAGAFSKAFLQEAQAVLESLGTSIARQTTETFHEVTATIYPDFDAFVEAISRHQVDVAIMSGMDYLAVEPRKLLEPALVGSSAGEICREYVVLARKERAVSDLKQLRGGAMIIESGGWGHTPAVWLDIHLHQKGYGAIDTLFKQVQHVDKASQAVLPVFFGKADACLTTLSGFQTMAELNPQMGQSLQAVCRSPKLLRGVICFRAGYDQRLREIVVGVLESLHENPDGQQILLVMREEKVDRYRPEYLESSRMLYRLRNSLSANQ